MTDYGALKAAAGRGRQVAVASDVILALLAEREEMRLLVDAIGKQREVNAAKDAQLEALCAENHAHTLRVIHANDVLLAEVRRLREALEELVNLAPPYINTLWVPIYDRARAALAPLKP